MLGLKWVRARFVSGAACQPQPSFVVCMCVNFPVPLCCPQASEFQRQRAEIITLTTGSKNLDKLLEGTLAGSIRFSGSIR